MTSTEAKLANATAIETYGDVMRSKGLLARADWAYAEARRIRGEVEAAAAPRALAA